MYINEDLHIQTVDDANISIIDIKLNKSYFDIFKCEKPVTFDFSLDDLCKILKICRNSRVIHFLFEESIVKIIIIQEDIKKVFKLNSIYTTYNLIDINKIELENIFIMESKLLKSIFDDLFIFSDDIGIKINKLGLHFYSSDDNIDIKYKIDNITSNTDIQSLYSLKYLAKYKIFSYFKNVEISFDKNKPLLLNVSDNDCIIKFIISPRLT